MKCLLVAVVLLGCGNADREDVDAGPEPLAYVNPVLVPTDTGYLVVHEDLRRSDGAMQLVATPLDPGGALVGKPVALGQVDLYGLVAVATNGTSVLAAWMVGSTVHLSLLDPSGESIASSLVEQGSRVLSLKAAFTSEEYLVAWLEQSSPVFGPDDEPDGVITGARVTTDGRFLDPDGIPLPLESAHARWEAIELASGPDGALLLAASLNKLVDSPVLADGTLRVPSGVVLSKDLWNDFYRVPIAADPVTGSWLLQLVQSTGGVLDVVDASGAAATSTPSSWPDVIWFVPRAGGGWTSFTPEDSTDTSAVIGVADIDGSLAPTASASADLAPWHAFMTEDYPEGDYFVSVAPAAGGVVAAFRSEGSTGLGTAFIGVDGTTAEHRIAGTWP
jgi:hypothetical protein